MARELAAQTNDQGKYEIEVTLKVTLDPNMVGYDLSEHDLRQEVLTNMRTGSYLVETVELLD